MTVAASARAHRLAEGGSDAVGAQLPWDPLANGRLAAARRKEREALSRYRALIVASRESLRQAEERFRAASDAVDRHIEAVLAAFAGRGSFSRTRVAASGATALSRRRVVEGAHGTARR